MKEPFEILIVEDYEPDVQFAFRLFRKERIGNKLYVVRDGAEALDFLFSRGPWLNRAGSQQPLVVLMDIRLPKLDGWEILRQLQNEPLTRAIRVVMISGTLFPGEVQRWRQTGAIGCLTKPIRMEEFRTLLAEAGCSWSIVSLDEINEALT